MQPVKEVQIAPEQTSKDRLLALGGLFIPTQYRGQLAINLLVKLNIYSIRTGLTN